VPVIVAKREGILDEDLYYAPRGADPLRDDDPVPAVRTDKSSVDLREPAPAH
jgi:hypothetical protein